MQFLNDKLKHVVTAAGLCLVLSTGSYAQTDELDRLFTSLQNAGPRAAAEIEERIWAEWSKSGSASMDLLLDRGRKALSEGDVSVAIEHFTALIDHAPEFAEGYNARATAYFQADLYGPSIEDIRQTLRLNPRHFGAMQGLGLIFQEIGRPDEALAVYREVEAIHPNREGLQEAIERLEREVEGEAL